METTAHEYFGAMAAGYDSLVRRAVPRYDEMVERQIDFMPARAERVLELGCGTGNLTLALADRYPRAELTLVDASAEMLEAARVRLGPERAPRLVHGAFEDLDPEPGRYDLISSCMSVHHVVDKPALYRTLHASLAPGGWLVLADQLGNGVEEHLTLNWNRMLDYWRRPGHLTTEEQASLTEHSSLHDHYQPVYELLRQLEHAGFRHLDCVWRSGMLGLITAQA